MMLQAWFETAEMRCRKFASSAWIPMRAVQPIYEQGNRCHLGFKEEFFGAGSLAVPVELKNRATKFGWSDVGISHEHRACVDDGCLIKNKAKEYGFQLAVHDEAASRIGLRFLNFKTKRNELAHGGISFEDCGQDTSVDELVAIFDEIKIFIKAVLDVISDFLSTKSYLHAVNANTAMA